MDKRIKVCIVNEPLKYGGINLASIRFQEALDSKKYEFVYCLRYETVGNLEQRVIDNGCRVVHVPNSELSDFKSYMFYKKLFSEEHFDIVHCHLPFFSGIVLMAAAKCGVQKRVAHAHFSQPYTDTNIYSKPKQFIAYFYRKAMRVLLKKYCNVKIACSRESGEFLYGKKEFERNGIILNNGINVSEYDFNTEVRNRIREQLSLRENDVALVHIGMMYSVKNQSFVIDIFEDYDKLNPDSYLFLVGNGPDKDYLTEKVNQLECHDRIVFLGEIDNVNELLQAMDLLVFPSLHEGFPLVLIEAQASKLPCLISDSVTVDTKLNENVEYFSLNNSALKWAEEVKSLLSTDRADVDNSKVYSDFDLNSVSRKLDKLYSS